MLEVSTTPVTFKYQRPDSLEKPKTFVWLCRTDRMVCDVQVVKKDGGETNLHSHSHLDGFWFVLSGRARFYGDGDALLGDLGPHEGILLPRGSKYWFESASDEPLELLQIESADKVFSSQEELVSDRIDYAPAKAAGGAAHLEAASV
jgi:mannose-6-phosphate isomerase-like protein (cupin superfamily)